MSRRDDYKKMYKELAACLSYSIQTIIKTRMMANAYSKTYIHYVFITKKEKN